MNRKKNYILAVVGLLLAFVFICLPSGGRAHARVTVKSPVIRGIDGDKNVVTLWWSRTSKAKGYILYYKEKGQAFRKAAVLKKERATLYGLKAGTAYTFKVKAGRKVKGTYYYSKFSKKAKFRTNPEQVVQAATLRDFLANAVKPLGTTLYVWGGGWGPEHDTLGGHISARTVEPSRRWKKFFNSQTASYSYTSTMYQSQLGLDCSGYVGWCMYSTLNTKNGNNGYVELAQHMAKDFAARGWGKYTRRSKVKNWKPGDIMSSECSDCRHVWICMGACEDGSLVALHSTSSGGVQLSGTPTPEGKAKSQAAVLAMRYMRKYCPKWSSRYSKGYSSHLKGISYLSHYCRMRWDVSGRSILTDPDGIQEMSAKETLAEILGPA